MNFPLQNLSRFTSRPEQTQIALGIVALVALVFGFWQLKTAIHLPIGSGEINQNIDISSQQALLGQDILRLQQMDSDGDGISDYDELYVYGTSPYLVDTDSDGIDDKTEIERGTDPNCAEGTTCTPVVISPPSQPATDITPTPTAAEIRAFLRQSGASEEQLASYDDATLIVIYREISGELSSTASGGQDNITNQDFVLTPEQKQLIKNMSISELRQFLINGGADPELLQQVDDATLRATVNQQLGL